MSMMMAVGGNKISKILFFFAAAFIFLLLPSSTSVNAIQWHCGDDWKILQSGKSSLTDDVNFIKTRQSQTKCPSPCVIFKCIVEGDYGDQNLIIRATTCYEIFHNTCKYVPTQVKEMIQANVNNFTYFDEAVMFFAMDNAYDHFPKWIQTQENAQKKFASHIPRAESTLDRRQGTYRLLLKAKEQKDNVKCNVGHHTQDDNKFEIDEKIKLIPNAKTCEACVAWISTDGNGVQFGTGCFEDFDKFHSTVSCADKELVKRNLKYSHHYGNNFIAVSCSYADNCGPKELKLFTQIYPNIHEKSTKYVASNANGASCFGSHSGGGSDGSNAGIPQGGNGSNAGITQGGNGSNAGITQKKAEHLPVVLGMLFFLFW